MICDRGELQIILPNDFPMSFDLANVCKSGVDPTVAKFGCKVNDFIFSKSHGGIANTKNFVFISCVS